MRLIVIVALAWTAWHRAAPPSVVVVAPKVPAQPPLRYLYPCTCNNPCGDCGPHPGWLAVVPGEPPVDVPALSW